MAPTFLSENVKIKLHNYLKYFHMHQKENLIVTEGEIERKEAFIR